MIEGLIEGMIEEGWAKGWAEGMEDGGTDCRERGAWQGERREEEPLIYGPPRPHPGARFGQLSMEAGKSPVRSRIRSQVRALSRVTRSYVKRGNVAHARVAQLEERVLPTVLFAAQRHAVCDVASHHSTRIG